MRKWRKIKTLAHLDLLSLEESGRFGYRQGRIEEDGLHTLKF